MPDDEGCTETLMEDSDNPIRCDNKKKGHRGQHHATGPGFKMVWTIHRFGPTAKL